MDRVISLMFQSLACLTHFVFECNQKRIEFSMSSENYLPVDAEPMPGWWSEIRAQAHLFIHLSFTLTSVWSLQNQSL